MQFTDIRFHNQLFSSWKKLILAGRFPHTVLLAGKDGWGTLYSAMKLADALLCNTPGCTEKLTHLNHPDLHFIFPTVTSPKYGQEVRASLFIPEWSEFIRKHLFGNYDDWMQYLQAGNKQGIIRVKDAEDVIHSAFQYPSLGTNKVYIIWHAEKMNSGTANKLLKILEEPPENTFFILTSDQPAQIISTVLSRCQIFDISPVPYDEMKQNLLQFSITETEIEQIIQAASGDWNKALKLLENQDPFELHKDYFVRWVRIAYTAKKKPKAINELIRWSEDLAGEPKFFQNDFLRFALEVFRRAYLFHFNPEIPFFNFQKQNFALKKFAPFVHSGNIEEFYQAINDSVYHLARNAHPKITFLDLSIRLTRLLHKKEN